MSESFQDREIQERLFPNPGDQYYLALSDLLLAVSAAATLEPVVVLDCGAGCSPYRSLFPHSRYLRADVANPIYPTPDCVISPDGRVSLESKSIDYVLSTQVLEHVRN